MSFISYAQNFEDVMLWRALKHIENGFYIDVGANDPILDSVTRAFYHQGWRGINVEPLLNHFKELNADRPDDINLNYALSDSAGELNIWECDVRGWATFDINVVNTHEANGYKGQWHKVTVRTLAEVCTEYQTKNIHFLKVDVEGFELAVLKGNDWNKYRPWIVVVEATLPNTQIETHSEIDEFLIAKNYIFAYADGLNRFYVAKEHENLLPAFKYPPNIFDDFKSSGWQAADEKLAQEQTRIAQFEIRAEQAEARAEQAEARAEQAEVDANQYSEQLRSVYASNSWRLIASLRKIKNFFVS